jgi:hypothetical protein
MDIRKPIPTLYGYFQERFGAGWLELIEKLKTTLW